MDNFLKRVSSSEKELGAKYRESNSPTRFYIPNEKDKLRFAR